MAGNSVTTDRQKKIALFLPYLAGGGAERVMLAIADGFIRRDIEVDLVLANRSGPYISEIPDLVNVIDLNCSRTVSAIPGLSRYLRRQRPTAILATLNHANIIAILAKQLANSQTKLFVREANTITHLKTPDLRDRIMPWLIKWLYPKAAGVITGSAGVAGDLENSALIPRPLIHIIYNPVVTEKLFAKAKKPLELPWTDDNTPLIVAAGRLTEQKNFTMLIRAFAKVCKTTSARLLILGEGEKREQLEQLINAMNPKEKIALPGFVNNPFPFMARADLFVLSSSWEGSPNALIQAIALGTPAVSTDCPFGPAEILANGKYGLLSPVNDEDALATNMIKSLESPIKVPDSAWQDYEQNRVIDSYYRLFFSSTGV